jgi:general stress protein YciG
MADDGRGWHGDPEGHAKAGSQSSGNKNAAENLDDEARSKGGSASGGNFKNPERAREAGRKGGSK